MKGFEKPKEVKGVDVAFGGDMERLLPNYNDIPKEFKDFNGSNKWVDFINSWFYKGLSKLELNPKEGIDIDKAFKHISAILKSFKPKHEHKIAGCAYLMSLWFIDVEYETN